MKRAPDPAVAATVRVSALHQSQVYVECSYRRRQSNCSSSVGTASATISSGAPFLMVRAIPSYKKRASSRHLEVEGLDRREDCVQWPRTPAEMGAAT